MPLGDALLDLEKINLLRPKDKKPLTVSPKSKDAMVRGNKSGAKLALVFGILIAIAGILIMIFMR